MALESMKIGKAPAAFAGQAAVVNALVDLISKMRGTSGIICQVTEGGIVISLNPTALQGLNTGCGGGGGNSNVSGTVQAISTNGILVDVVQPTSPNTPNTYPTFLGVRNAGATINIGTAGWSHQTSSYDCIYDSAAGTFGVFKNTGEYVRMQFGGGGPDLVIHGTAHELSVKEWTGCNSGSPGNYLAVTSDFY